MIDGVPAGGRWAMAFAVAALHGLAWFATGSPGGLPADTVVAEPERPPLQVMLLSEHVGHGDAILADAAPVPMPAIVPFPVPPAPQPPPSVDPVSPEIQVPERPALPVTAPNLDKLRGLPAPVAPIRLRLYVNASGKVTRVEVVEAAPSDEAFVQGLVEILEATAHIPARRDGRDVDSVKNLVLDFGSAN